MSLELIFVFSILLITIVLFVTELFPVDKIAFFIIVSITLLGLVTPEEAISGFSNPATITVLCLMIIALGLEENGVIAMLTAGLKKISVLHLALLIPLFMIITASISAFISTTAVVIIFIKIVLQLADRFNIPSSKILMPVSFAGILGGSCTLMGTSTNLIVNSVAQQLGMKKMGFFEFAPFGLVFLAIGIVVVTVASRLLPRKNPVDATDAYGLKELLTNVEITEDSPLIGKRIDETFFGESQNVSVLKMMRNFTVTNAPGKYIQLQKGDKLMVMSDFDNMVKLAKTEGFIINEKRKAHKETDENEEDEKNSKTDDLNRLVYIELLILPGSILLGKTLRDLRYFAFRGGVPIAIKKRKNIRNTRERLIRKDIKEIRLKPGDRVLVEIAQRDIAMLEDMENVAIMQQYENTSTFSPRKKYTSLFILLLVIGLAASGALSILASSLTGVALMLLTNCLVLNKVYQKVDWQIIFLLAGMIPLGIALSNTGADQWISSNLLAMMEGKPDVWVLGLIFFFTMLLSGTVSNNATAIIMAPIAIAVAAGLGLDPKPFILAVMFGANFSFFTPVGYQTNTLIYGLGIYSFRHFALIGGILSIILLIVGTLMLSTMFN
ncbi:MAG: SLC13 family permease [Cytophagaceae bacterium]|nr:SLC13 family permease [Cytophagaceae bacterium]|tara:strand:- start:1977 stop:3806 length:1830 start_codon:yes stop_codon:yes gene_type:complete